MVGAAAKFGAAVAAVSGVAGASVAAQSVAVGLVVVVFLRCLIILLEYHKFVAAVYLT